MGFDAQLAFGAELFEGINVFTGGGSGILLGHVWRE